MKPMENNMTAVEWLIQQIEEKNGKDFSSYYSEFVNQAKEMEKEQHGETWDAALIHVDKRGGVILRALVDFDEYWEDKSKTPPGEHCKEA
jgi:hypothetical protein